MINNIKNSFVDICGYISYMCRRLIQFWLVFLILIIVCCLVYKFVPKDIANNFWGVIISIIAAVLFEGYRSYKKYKEDLMIMNFCLGDLRNSIEQFSCIVSWLPFNCDIRLVLNNKYGKILYHKLPGATREYKKNLMLLKRDVILFDNLRIPPKFKVVNGKEKYYKVLNLEYEKGLCFYEYLKNILKKKLIQLSINHSM